MFFRNGVNLVIGAHPHVIQPMEKHYSANGRCDKLVAYSLGNFVSNQPFLNTDGGAILKVIMLKDETGVRITWAGYNLIWVYKPKENGKTRHYILPVADYEDNTEKLNATFRKDIKRFANNARTLLNKANIGVGEYRILPPRRKVEPLHRIEAKPVSLF
jgi:poly-gamma-glutamate synthesis protein (capsule biosynthesis protein)